MVGLCLHRDSDYRRDGGKKIISVLESQAARNGDAAMTEDTNEKAIKLSLEKQRDDAILRARQEYLTQKDANGAFLVIPLDFDAYIERCQNAQDRYEEDLGAATGKFVEHVDVRFNLDDEGNWIRPDTPIETSASSGVPITRSRFPQLSAKEKAIMARGFERLRHQMESERGLERRWPKLSDKDWKVVAREFKRLQIPPPKPQPSVPVATQQQAKEDFNRSGSLSQEPTVTSNEPAKQQERPFPKLSKEQRRIALREYKRVKVADLHFLPDLTPKHDERFSALLDGAVSGDVPVYLAAVPLAICVPFDLDYRPDLHPVGKQAISQMIDDWSKGQFQNLFVYQRGKRFVVSDDYIQLFAALRGQPDYVPCWVLGKPDSDLVRDVQGPIAPNDVPKLLGIA